MAEMAKGNERPAADVPQVAREPHVADRNGRDLAIGPSGWVHYSTDNVGDNYWSPS